VADGLARGVALGPGGVGDEQRYASNRRYVAETGCTWVRLWAEWPKLQPDPAQPPDFAPLDGEIAAARADGLKVMLTSWRFPRWANDTAVLTPEQDAAFELPARARPGADPARRKDLTFRVPADLSPESPYGHWIAALGDRDADAIEVVNEPNHQLWPQRDVHRAVARMMATARAVLESRELTIVGPATADRVGSGPLDTDHLEFARALLDELDAIGFHPDPRTAWSHHNYADVESDSTDRVEAAGALVRERWPGAPILVTETGARLTTIAREERLRDDVRVRRRQAELLAANYERLRTTPAGAGVEMVLQYLFITDMNYDSGLCELDGRPRPAYYAWAELPTLR
jgi:hypothetical protein